jgi:hypothetical protein
MRLNLQTKAGLEGRAWLYICCTCDGRQKNSFHEVCLLRHGC